MTDDAPLEPDQERQLELELEALELDDVRDSEFKLTIGGEHHRPIGGNISARMNDRSRASFALDLRNIAAIDLSAPVAVLTPGEVDGVATHTPRFAGHVTTARSRDGITAIEAEGARDLVESTVGMLHAAAVPVAELTYITVRSGGYTRDRVSIQGLDELPLEVFVVEMPVTGIDVQQPVHGLGVEFLPIDCPDGESSTGPFAHVTGDISTRWGQPTARARTYVTETLLYEAGELGSEVITRALDALLATATYGLSRDPWQNELAFDRSQLRARPRALPVVFAQGVGTGRRALRSISGGPIDTRLDVTTSLKHWTQLLSVAPPQDLRRGLTALRDAADEQRDVYDRCHALSTVLEYYAASAKPPHVVSRQAKKSVLRALSTLEMSDTERERLRAVIGQVNTPPLLTRVRHQAAEDGAPISDTEWSVVKRLREARNNTVHGKSRSDQSPDADDLQWGVSIASRLLLYRWAATEIP